MLVVLHCKVTARFDAAVLIGLGIAHSSLLSDELTKKYVSLVTGCPDVAFRELSEMGVRVRQRAATRGHCSTHNRALGVSTYNEMNVRLP